MVLLRDEGWVGKESISLKIGRDIGFYTFAN